MYVDTAVESKGRCMALNLFFIPDENGVKEYIPLFMA
jgi:hypothetical protein